MRKLQSSKAENIARDLLRKLGPSPTVAELVKREEKPALFTPRRDAETAM